MTTPRRLLPIILAATALQLAGPGVAHAASPATHRPPPGRHVHHGPSPALPGLQRGDREEREDAAVA